MESARVPPGVRRPKKKQVKDELDRLKQAEKKKRRLEKALATSAAIRTELEKKKQKKKEEQQRLDEEGAAIAEAVALHVLLGEDSCDSCEIMLDKDEGFRPWACAGKIDFFMGGRQVVLPHQDLAEDSFEGIRWVSSDDGSGCACNEWGNNDLPVSSGPFLGIFARHIPTREVGRLQKYVQVILRHRLLHHSKLQKMQLLTLTLLSFNRILLGKMSRLSCTAPSPCLIFILVILT